MTGPATSAPRARVPRLQLLRPSWVVLHVLLVAAVYAMVRLGNWQWGRGEELRALRNYSYGLEWWAFALLSALGWVKFCYDETLPPERAATPQPVAGPVLPSAQPVSADEDPELAAWNARFAELARRDTAGS